jgi:hypothetical protein
VELKACETADPATFATVLTEAFSAYYADPGVMTVIQGVSGFPARPPHPEGHYMEPFDWSILDSRRRKDTVA